MDFLLAVLVIYLIGQSSCQTATDAQNLKTQLFTTNAYDRRIRPVADQSEDINIYVEFYLLAINSLDEKDETLKTTGYLSLYWIDEFLTWNQATYGGIEYYHYPQNDVWKPDVTLKNSYLDYKQLGDSSLNVKVYYNGVVRWSPFQVFQSTCSIDITKFPFDIQICDLKFVAWSYTKTEVYMEGGANGIVLEEYEANSAWEVINTNWYNIEEGEEATIVFQVKMQRKPLYNLLNLVFPIIMLSILNLFVFVLPCESGEKAGYAVTVFLAFAVFLTIMEASFPQNSDTVSYFAMLVVLETVQSTMITLIALAMVRVSSFGDNTPIPGCLISFTRLIKCKALNKKHITKKNRVDANTKVTIMTLDDIHSKDKQHDTDSLDDGDATTNELYTWKYVVNAFDTFFLVMFFTAFVVATLVCLLLAKYS